MSYPTIHRLPSWAPMAGIMLFGSVWLKDPSDKLTLDHELVHVDQYRRQPFLYYIKYLFLPLLWGPWRARFEAEAYAVQARAGCPVEGDRGLAAYLSGPAYGWCCRKETAARLIKEYT